MTASGLGKRIGALAAAFAVTVMIPGGAWAAKSSGAPTVTKEQRAAGMAAAPGLISGAGLDCQLADARKIGDSIDPKTKVKTTVYELACTGNEGMVVETVGTAAPQTFTCLQADQPTPDGKPSTVACVLPANADPKAGLVPYIAKAGIPCTPEKARALGQSPTQAIFELACQENNGGYILEISSPPSLAKPVTMNPCIGFSENSNVKCELTDRAAQMAVVDKLVAASGKPCDIKQRGYIGQTDSGKRYFEVACQNGKGYVLEEASNGAFGRAIDCAEADTIAGGCKLTDTRQAKTEQAGLYTQLAKKSGYDCNVSGYAPLPLAANIPAHSEVIELACSNRPDGAIGVFPASGQATIYDCAHSELVGYRCSLSKVSAAYPKLTADLKAFNKTSCTVSNARSVGVSADKTGFVEVGCSDGLQGYMIEYSIAPKITAKNVIICAEAKGIAGGCTLPGNTKKS